MPVGLSFSTGLGVSTRKGQDAFHAGGCEPVGNSAKSHSTRLASCPSGQRNNRREGFRGSPLARWRPTRKSTRPPSIREFSSSSINHASRAKRSTLVRRPSRTRMVSGRKRSPRMDSGKCPSLIPATIKCGASSQANSSQPWMSTASAGRSGNTASRPTASSNSTNASAAAGRLPLPSAASHSLSRAMNSRADSKSAASSSRPSVKFRSPKADCKNSTSPSVNGVFSIRSRIISNCSSAARAWIRFPMCSPSKCSLAAALSRLGKCSSRISSSPFCMRVGENFSSTLAAHPQASGIRSSASAWLKLGC